MGGNCGAEKITYRLIPWNNRVADHISVAPVTDPTIEPITYFQQMVLRDEARVFGVFAGENHIASLIAQIIEGNKGAELVVLVIGSDDPKAGIFDTLPAMEHFARRYKCQGIRFETCRPGFVRKAEKHGYKVTDYVMRKAVAV